MTPFDLYPEQTYRRKPPFRERVRIRRIWTQSDVTLLRVHPVKGGKPLICDAEWFQANFEVAE